MIVCVCKAVSDRHIRSAVKGGANCMRDLTRELGVGTCCGKCVPEARSVLSASLDSAAEGIGAGYFASATAEFAA
jgi:bacterioferritin-associated ferredoxin